MQSNTLRWLDVVNNTPFLIQVLIIYKAGEPYKEINSFMELRGLDTLIPVNYGSLHKYSCTM